MRTKHVVVLPYDEKWKKDFFDIKNELQQALGELAISIEHVGSTSVEGLAAKPIIDIDVIVKKENINDAISALKSIGYIHEGDLGIPGREAFAYDGKEHLQQHHLYVCQEDSLELKRHIAFRNYLRMHPEAVDEYSKVKIDAATLYPENIEKYIEYKTPFIKNIYSNIVK